MDGNRAALMLLVTQNVVSVLCAGMYLPINGQAVHIGLGWPLGASLLASFVVTVLLAFLLFRPTMQALAADTRWRTPPAWGLALAAFALGFLASRAFALAYITLVPSAVSSMPQFLSHGPDLWVLMLAAGVLIPFAEEVAFRGLMMRGQERAAGFGVAAIATTCAFGLAHGVPAAIVGILPLAYVLARVVQHTGSLWSSVIVHALNNLFSVGLGSVVAGKTIGNQSQALDLIKNESMRIPIALVALVFGSVVLTVAHLMLKPRPDAQVESQRGPWFSAAYAVIVLLGLYLAFKTLPMFAPQASALKGVLH